MDKREEELKKAEIFANVVLTIVIAFFAYVTAVSNYPDIRIVGGILLGAFTFIVFFIIHRTFKE